MNNSYSLNILNKCILAYRYFYHLLFTNFCHLGSRITFNSGVTIQNGSHIWLGNRVYLEKNVTLKFLEEFNDRNYRIPNLKIDDNVLVGTGSLIAAAKFIHIEKNVIIGPYCFIGDHDHEYIDITTPIKDQGYKNVKDVIVGEGAWIAANTTVCSGVTIGKNSVIGANSVVINDIPAFSMAAGTPAKVIKKFNSKTNKWEKK